MGTFRCKVEVIDKDGTVLATEWAYGNTVRTAQAAASCARVQLEREYEEQHPYSYAQTGRVVSA